MEVAGSAGSAAAGGTVGGVWRETHDSRELLATPADLAVGRVAARQGGVVSAAQLHAAGLGRGAIHTRVRRRPAGRALHRGVYAVGHAQLTPLGWRWAAVLACGGPGRAALSHRSAAAVWDLLPSPAKFDVTTLASARSTAKIRVHRSTTLTPADITEHDGLPVTTVARTLVDLTTILTPAPASSASSTERSTSASSTYTHSMSSWPEPRAAARRSLRRRARRRCRPTTRDITRSELEERFLALIAQCAVAAARGQRHDRPLRGRLLLARSAASSSRPTARPRTSRRPAFEDDRRRDAVLLDDRVTASLRFTWRQVAATRHARRRAVTPASRG